MNKIYLVTEGSYSSYGVVAAFSTREKAEGLVELMRDDKRRDDPCVEEYELDPEYGDYEVWKVCMKIDGSLIDTPNKSQEILPFSPIYNVLKMSHFDKKSRTEKIDYLYLNYCAICKSKEQAIKSANEIRTQLIALDRWRIDDIS